MPNNTKFLTLAVQLNKIHPSVRGLILEEQKQQQLLGVKKILSGELLVKNDFISEDEKNLILSKQNELRAQKRRFVPDFSLEMPIEVQRLVLAAFAIVSLFILVEEFEIALEHAVEYVSFGAFVVGSVVEYWGNKIPISHAIINVGKFFLLFFSMVLIFYSLISIYRLSNIGGVHSDPEINLAVSRWLISLKISIFVLLIPIMGLSVYGFWKFKSQRYVEARMGALKDIIVRIERALREKDLPLSERKEKAAIILLKGLRNIIRLTTSDSAFYLLRLIRPATKQISIKYLEPSGNGEFFKVKYIAHPDKVPERVIEAFTWVKENHQPTFLNEAKFEEAKSNAKGINHKGWVKRYLNFENRHHFISVCGWVFEKKTPLLAENASNCLAFDGSYVKQLESQGFSRDEINWLEVGSFVACPVVDKNSNSRGVLLVLCTLINGLFPNDLELVITISQLLGRILNEGEKDVEN